MKLKSFCREPKIVTTYIDTMIYKDEKYYLEKDIRYTINEILLKRDGNTSISCIEKGIDSVLDKYKPVLEKSILF